MINLCDQHWQNKPFQLIDLNAIKDEELKKHAWSGVMTLTLKHIFEKDIFPYCSSIVKIIHNIDPIEGKNYISLVLQYILERGEFKNRQDFYDIIQQEISPEIGEKVMTLGEQLRLEGKQQGLLEGHKKGKEEKAIEVAKRLLSMGLEDATIANATLLPLLKIQELQKELQAG